MTEAPLVVVDSGYEAIDLGHHVDGGNGITGEIVDFIERGPNRVAVAVEWPDSPMPEIFETALVFAGGIAVHRCEEVKAA